MKNDNANNNIHDNDCHVLSRICAIDMKSFNIKTNCPNCKHEFVSDKEIVYVHLRNNVPYYRLSFSFTGEIAKEKVSFVAKEETITKCFAIAINKKLALTKSMLNSKADIVYKLMKTLL